MACNSPLQIPQNGKLVTVPCRWCMGCRIQRRNEWAFRMRLEAYQYYKRGLGSTFFTCTYNDEHYTGSAEISDMQKMLKRFRYYLSDTKFNSNGKSNFKYYICSEYGDESTLRGHFHGIFFGIPSEVAAPYLRRSWGKGFIQYSPVCSAHFRYVLKYMDKQCLSDKDKEDYRRVFGRTPPTSIFSKGLGFSYYKEHQNELSQNNYLFVDGKPHYLSSYYMRKLGLDVADKKAEQTRSIHDTLRYMAEKNNMSLSEYNAFEHYNNELKRVKEARLHGFAVSDESLEYARRNLDYVREHIQNSSEYLNDIINVLYKD